MIKDLTIKNDFSIQKNKDFSLEEERNFLLFINLLLIKRFKNFSLKSTKDFNLQEAQVFILEGEINLLLLKRFHNNLRKSQNLIDTRNRESSPFPSTEFMLGVISSIKWQKLGKNLVELSRNKTSRLKIFFQSLKEKFGLRYGLRSTKVKCQGLKATGKSILGLIKVINTLAKLAAYLAASLAIDLVIGCLANRFPFINTGLSLVYCTIDLVRKVSFWIWLTKFGLKVISSLKDIKFSSFIKNLKSLGKKENFFDKKKVAYLAMTSVFFVGFDWKELGKNTRKFFSFVSTENQSFRTPSEEYILRNEYNDLMHTGFYSLLYSTYLHQGIEWLYENLIYPWADDVRRHYNYNGQPLGFSTPFMLMVLRSSFLDELDIVLYAINVLSLVRFTMGASFQVLGVLEILGASKIPAWGVMIHCVRGILYELTFSEGFSEKEKLIMKKCGGQLQIRQNIGRLTQMSRWRETLDVGAGVPNLYVVPVTTVLKGLPIKSMDWLPVRYLNIGATAWGGGWGHRLDYSGIWRDWGAGDSPAYRIWKNTLKDFYTKKQY